jgi:hypothetical protein
MNKFIMKVWSLAAISIIFCFVSILATSKTYKHFKTSSNSIVNCSKVRFVSHVSDEKRAIPFTVRFYDHPPRIFEIFSQIF